MEFLCVTFSGAMLFVLLCSSLYFYFIVYPSVSRRKSDHGFKLYPVLGALPDFLFNRHRFLDWVTDVLAGCPANTTIFRRPGKVFGVITANPQVIEYVLKNKFENYNKGPRFRSLLQDFLGDGIFNADGDLWRVQRKTASYEFNTKSLRNFVMECVTSELKSRLIPLLEETSRNGKQLDFQDILERFAFDNICKLSFNFDPHCLGGDNTIGSGFMQAFEDAAVLSSGRFLYALVIFVRIKKFFNVGSEKKLRKSIAVVHQFADEIIRTRLQQGNTNAADDDLLSRFIERTENSAKYLRDIVISFILAGRDTTSSALSWFFWLLSVNPRVEEKILQELETIRSRSGKSIGEIYSFDELREMHYLHASISEAMRLYPPVPVDTLSCVQDDTLPDGTFIGKDWFISYFAYAMGRMESIWGKDCCEYKPERWMEKGVCKIESPFKYPVFHGGPRMCLGKELAYIQMKSITASVLERFSMDVLLEKGKPPEHVLSLTLRIKGGLPVNVYERDISQTRLERM